jgi:hypothetical protein
MKADNINTKFHEHQSTGSEVEMGTHEDMIIISHATFFT